jgi:sugar lactone lactonase YvrE
MTLLRAAAALFPLCAFSLVAGCGSGSGSAPSGSIASNAAALTFAATVDQTSATQAVTITNSGNATTQLQTVAVSGANASDFSITASTCTAGLALNAGATCMVTLSFTPAAAGSRVATLAVPSASNTLMIALNGTGTSLANVSVAPTTLTFGTTPINQAATAQTITVTNSGGTAATLGMPALSGANAIDFAITATTCTATLTGNANCTYTITFTPTATGTRTASFSVGESSLSVANTFKVTLNGTGSPANLGLLGTVLSGTTPVENATIQLYTVGAGGNGSLAKAMLPNNVTTNAAGNFYLATGAPLTLSFNCGTATDQVYVVASGGNAALTPTTTNNAALVMMTAIGNCGSLTAASALTINELTTAAASWALAQFASSAQNIGASATNKAGISNAMLDANLLANQSTGAAATVAGNLIVEPGKLPALADVIAPCVNSDGTTGCTPLFAATTPSGGSAPKDTLSAALYIVKHPATNIAATYALIPTTAPPYATTLTQAPNDWTISLAVSGGGLSQPTGIDIDSAGNVWVASYPGLLSGFTPQGTPLSATGYGAGATFEVYSMTIDTLGDLWLTNQQSAGGNAAGSVTKFTPGATAGTFASITPHFDSSIDFPIGVSADTNGDIFIGNYASSAVTAYTSAGAPLASHGTGLGSGYAVSPVAVAADNAHGVWIANSGSATVTHVSSTGTILSNLACCAGANGSNGIATDSSGNAWISDFGANAFSVISSGVGGDAILVNEKPLLGPGYTANPAGVAVDAAQNVWVANFRGRSVSELAGTGSSSALGTMLSPPTGFGYPSPATNPPELLGPEALVPDASGNLWVSNNANNNVLMFFGLATPTKTPVMPVPTAP